MSKLVSSCTCPYDRPEKVNHFAKDCSCTCSCAVCFMVSQLEPSSCSDIGTSSDVSNISCDISLSTCSSIESRMSGKSPSKQRCGARFQFGERKETKETKEIEIKETK